MTIRALRDFADEGRIRHKGDIWTPCCTECAMQLIRAGKAERVKKQTDEPINSRIDHANS